MYLMKKDIKRMKVLLRRGSDINFQSSVNGFTALHLAIENKLSNRYIKFLLKNGANPHIMDF
jgi:ankyrin repeat protein